MGGGVDGGRVNHKISGEILIRVKFCYKRTSLKVHAMHGW